MYSSTLKSIDARNLGFIAMTSSTVRTNVRPTLHVCQCDQYHASLQHTSLKSIDTCQNKLTTDQVLVFDCIARSTQVNSPKHKRKTLKGLFSFSIRLLRVCLFCFKTHTVQEKFIAKLVNSKANFTRKPISYSSFRDSCDIGF